MKTNKEIRREAREAMSGGWFGRVFASGAALYGIVLLVSGVIVAVYQDMSLQTWGDFLGAKLQHMRQGLAYAVPSTSAFWHMTGATVFQQFLMYVFGAIFVFGMSCLMLKAVRNDSQGWFASSFGGFARPLEVTWLLVLMNFRVFLWSLLLVIPGVVAIYRYRQAWYLKSEHTDWSAARCLSESGRIMRGNKWQAFCLDVFYMLQVFVVELVFLPVIIIVMTVFRANRAIAGALVGVAGVVCLYILASILIRYFAARAVFYRALAPVAVQDGPENPA